MSNRPTLQDFHAWLASAGGEQLIPMRVWALSVEKEVRRAPMPGKTIAAKKRDRVVEERQSLCRDAEYLNMAWADLWASYSEGPGSTETLRNLVQFAHAAGVLSERYQAWGLDGEPVSMKDCVREGIPHILLQRQFLRREAAKKRAEGRSNRALVAAARSEIIREAPHLRKMQRELARQVILRGLPLKEDAVRRHIRQLERAERGETS